MVSNLFFDGVTVKTGQKWGLSALQVKKVLASQLSKPKKIKCDQYLIVYRIAAKPSFRGSTEKVSSRCFH